MSSSSDLDLQRENRPGVPANGEERRPPRGHGGGRPGEGQAGGSDQTFLGAPEKWKGEFEWLVTGLRVHGLRVVVYFFWMFSFAFFLYFLIYLFHYRFVTPKKKKKINYIYKSCSPSL